MLVISAIRVRQRNGRNGLQNGGPDEGLYYADGQILEEVYVYGSFVQSKMYHAGVRCTDCHDPHSSKLVKVGNELCVQCHQPVANERFPELTLMNYDSPEHHFHTSESQGAQCVNCHAPSKSYMVLDPRRDHSFRIPRPDLSVKLGTPNACNQCHSNKTTQWAQRIAERWYGPETSRIKIGHCPRPGFRAFCCEVQYIAPSA